MNSKEKAWHECGLANDMYSLCRDIKRDVLIHQVNVDKVWLVCHLYFCF